MKSPIAGPPNPRVCGVNISSYHRLSYILSQMLRPHSAMFPDDSEITGELLSWGNECNCAHDLSNYVVGSMNIEPLYQPIDIGFAVERCMGIISESEVVFYEINTGVLCLLLKFVDYNEFLEKHDLSRLYHIRSERCRPPIITSAAMKASQYSLEMDCTPSEEPYRQVQ